MVDSKITAIAILTLLLGSGGTLLLTQEQYDKAYVCNSTTLRAMFFDKLSSTGKTGYYVDATGASKSAVCSPGWIKLDTFAKQSGLSKEQLVQSNINRIAESPLVWNCDETDCYCKINE